MFNDTTAYTNWSGSAVTFASNPLRFSFEARVPIAEWAGSGTVNLGPGAQVEYAASTNGTWNDAAVAANTVYGPAGAPITGSLGALRSKIVRFQYPVQADDLLILEYKTPNGNWIQEANTLYAFNYQKNAAFGARIAETAPGATDVEVYFYQYGAAGTTYGTADATAINWSTSFATAWRVRKAKASSPVGFGRATATDTGLVFRGRHQTKILASNQTSTASITGLTFNNLTIGKVYRVSGQAMISQNATNLQCELRFYDGTTSGTIIGGVQTNNTWSSGYTGSEYKVGFSFLYTATTVTMTSQWNTGSTSGILNGDGTRLRTFVTVEETDLDTTTAWV